MSEIKVLIIEENKILRLGLASLLKQQPDISVVGAVQNAESALKKAIRFKPDIVLLDFGLQNQNSLDVLKSLKDNVTEIKVIGMGLLSTQSDILSFVQGGADGFILKTASVDDLISTLRSISVGKTILPPPMAASLFFQVAENVIMKEKNKISDSVRMTKREKEIIALIVEGASNKDIANELNISTYTVKSHVHNILEKLALTSRLQISNYAQDISNT
ncbi:MAG: response regulator transcription factor [Candidatus Delongbacteria bacterium]|jgi:DNA-binding NarL/FixJ family response regulator|nr:response regulator transcription factor [Candidatus Delongbacteria bacterium]